MFVITENFLFNLLGLQIKNNTTTPEVKLSAIGPGLLDKYALIANDEKCFVQRVTKKTTQKPIVIVCDPFLAYRAPKEFDLQLIAALTTYCDVYLWQNTESLVGINPVASSEAFWQQRDSLKAATAQQVMHILSQQGLDANQFVVLDYARVSAICLQLAEERTNHLLFSAAEEEEEEDDSRDSSIDFQDQEADSEDTQAQLFDQFHAYTADLDLTYFNALANQNQFKEKFLPGLVADQIHMIAIDTQKTEAELKFLKDCFKNLDRIEVYPSPQESLLWIKNNAFLLFNLGLKCFNPVKSSLIIDENQENIDHILSSAIVYINSEEEFNEIHISPDIEDLILILSEQYRKNDCVLNINCPSLCVLTVIAASQQEMVTLNLASYPNLHTLVLDGSQFKFTGLSQTLKILHLQNGDITGPSLATISPQLKYLALTNILNAHNAHFEYLPTLEKLILTNPVQNTLDLEFYPALKNLIIENREQTLELKGNHQQLQTIAYRGKALTVNLDQCPNVRSLESTGKLLLRMTKDNHSIEQLKGSAIQLSQSSQKYKMRSLCYFNNQYCTEIKNKFYDYIYPEFKELSFSYHSLQENFYVNIKSSHDITLPQTIKCQYLSLHHCGLPSIDLAIFTAIKYLFLGATYPEIKIFGKNNTLERLSIADALVTACDISQCAQLKELTIQSNKPVNLVGLAQCTTLQILTIEAPNAIDFITHAPKNCLLYLSTPNSGTLAINESLRSHNEDSPVSRLQLGKQPSRGIDGNTDINQNAYEAQGDFTITLHCSEKSVAVNRDHYRIFFYDEIQLLNNDSIHFPETLRQCEDITSTITIIQKNPKTSTENLQQQAQSFKLPKNGLVYCGYLSGPLQKNELYPLPSQQPFKKGEINQIILRKGSPQLAVLWDEQHQQYWIQPNSSSTTAVDIFYIFEQQPASSDNQLLVTKNSICSRLNQRLIQVIQKFPPLQFLLETQQSTEQKLNQLIKYCSNFKNEPLSNQQNPTDFNILWQTISEQKGSCRHRANAFMALAQILGLTVRIVRNEQHAYCEVQYQITDNNPSMVWQRFDFGGAPVLDLTPTESRRNIFAMQPTQENLMPLPEKQPVHPLVTAYYKRLKARIAPQKIHNLADLFQLPRIVNDIQAPLILLRPNQSARHINLEILTICREKQMPHLYIETAKEFLAYFKAVKLANNQRQFVAGPLAALLQQGGVLVVNWTNFSATEIASYKSILDTPPTLLGEKVPNTLRVIGLIPKNKKRCGSFESRTTRYECAILPLPNLPLQEGNGSFMPPNQPDFGGKKPVKTETINLFSSLRWREHLLGEIILAGHTFCYKESAIITAIRNRQNVIIENPPCDNPAFDLFLYRLQQERKILFNGTMMDIPSDIEITTRTTEPPTLTKNITITEKLPQTEDKEIIYLGLHNLHECYEQLQVTKEQGIKTNLGYLATYDDDKHIFYIPFELPSSDWDELIGRIQKDFQHKKFTFVRHKTPQASSRVACSNRFHVSHDPDFCAAQLAQQCRENSKDPLMIHVTPNMQFSDLIGSMHLEQGDNQQINFCYQKKAMLQALKDGRPVILTGDVSPALYQSLLPLFGHPPTINVNAKRIPIPGKLFAVMTPQQAKNLAFNAFETHAATLTQYYSVLLKEPSSEDITVVKKIALFFTLAAQLPHQGLGQPEIPKLTYAWFKHFYTVLQKKHALHANNPIKGLFLYDYPKSSGNYAFLNVLAKLLFLPGEHQSKSRLHLAHQQDLVALKKGDHTRIWPILNHLAIGDLRYIFKTNLAATLNTDQPLNLTTGALARLKQVLFGKNLALPEKSQKSSTEKTLRRFESLLQDEQTPLIFFKGPPGVGKTYTIRNQSLKEKLNINYFEGEQGILDWLQAGSTNKTADYYVLLLDEANCQQSGSWDFLKGLTTTDKTVYYQGQVYTLSAKHKIVATGNEESLPGRQHHHFFQQYGETLFFKKPDDEFLTTHILKPTLGQHYTEEIAQILLFAYHHISDYQKFYTPSMRDLSNLAFRFKYLTEKNTESAKNSTFAACFNEFYGCIENPALRTRFKHDLTTQCSAKRKQSKGTSPTDCSSDSLTKESSPSDSPSNDDNYYKKQCITNNSQELMSDDEENSNKDPSSSLFAAIQTPKTTQTIPTSHFIPVHGDITIPESHQYLVEIIEQDLALRTYATQQIEPAHYKTGIILEGDSGIGKSTLLKAILEKNGFSANATDTQKKYYELSVGVENTAQLLEQAFHEGAVVILDELNLDPTIELLINQLLTGEDSKNQTAHKQGFMILSSQNDPSKEIGRKHLPVALKNRSHFLYMPAYSKTEKIALVKRKGFDSEAATDFVTAFEMLEKEDLSINMRTLRQVQL